MLTRLISTSRFHRYFVLMLLGLEELENFHSCKMCVRLFSRSQWSWGLKVAFALIFDMIRTIVRNVRLISQAQNYLLGFCILCGPYAFAIFKKLATIRQNCGN